MTHSKSKSGFASPKFLIN